MKSLRTQVHACPIVAALCTSSATLAQYNLQHSRAEVNRLPHRFDHVGRPATSPPKTDKPRTWVEYGSMHLGIASYVIHHGDRGICLRHPSDRSTSQMGTGRWGSSASL